MLMLQVVVGSCIQERTNQGFMNADSACGVHKQEVAGRGFSLLPFLRHEPEDGHEHCSRDV